MSEYRDQLRHVLCRHEQGAGHAAEGYARATGKVGVCIGTSGPGATNLVTPIADALDGLDADGRDHRAGVERACSARTPSRKPTSPASRCRSPSTTTWSRDAEDMPYVFSEAFYIASTGRPGPVLIDVTKDAQQAQAVPNWDVTLNLPGYKPTYAGNRKQIREAVELLERGQEAADHGRQRRDHGGGDARSCARWPSAPASR